MSSGIARDIKRCSLRKQKQVGQVKAWRPVFSQSHGALGASGPQVTLASNLRALFYDLRIHIPLAGACLLGGAPQAQQLGKDVVVTAWAPGHLLCQLGPLLVTQRCGC